MTRKNFFSILFLLAFVGLVNAQETTTIPTKKTNQRPTAKTPGEPFDNADVKKMAASCVKIETESGNIELEMFPESAPESVRNFLNLVAIKFYDTTLFSRVVPNFVVQGGNFFTRTVKQPEFYERSKKTVRDEPSLIKHERGIVSMARSDEPNSASTHFFILVGEAKHLDGKFAAFGRVIKGMEIVDAINKMPAVEEKPEKPVRLIKATIIACPVKEQ
jgi:peptidyl-prolyl cis-trans isomerase B (cyclophilin B)